MRFRVLKWFIVFLFILSAVILYGTWRLVEWLSKYTIEDVRRALEAEQEVAPEPQGPPAPTPIEARSP